MDGTEKKGKGKSMNGVSFKVRKWEKRINEEKSQ